MEDDFFAKADSRFFSTGFSRVTSSINRAGHKREGKDFIGILEDLESWYSNDSSLVSGQLYYDDDDIVYDDYEFDSDHLGLGNVLENDDLKYKCYCGKEHALRHTVSGKYTRAEALNLEYEKFPMSRFLYGGFWFGKRNRLYVCDVETLPIYEFKRKNFWTGSSYLFLFYCSNHFFSLVSYKIKGFEINLATEAGIEAEKVLGFPVRFKELYEGKRLTWSLEKPVAFGLKKDLPKFENPKLVHKYLQNGFPTNYNFKGTDTIAKYLKLYNKETLDYFLSKKRK